MVSDTAKTRLRRRLKQAKMGRARKKQLAKKGTTPPFPLHPDKAREASK